MLPPPLEWPTARMIARDRAGAAMLSLFALGPFVLAAAAYLRAPDRREWPLILLLAGSVLSLFLAPVVVQLVGRGGRGLRLSAVRGGAEAAIEVGARDGTGGAIVLPLRLARKRDRIYRVGLKRIAVAESLALTAAGPVLFARGGTSLDPELVSWIDRVLAATGEVATRAPHIDDLAAAAARAPLHGPDGIEASTAGGWPTWRYRSPALGERNWILAWLALVAAWLILLPATGLFPLRAVAPWLGVPGAALIWLWVLAGPRTVEVQVRGSMLLLRRKWGRRTLWTSVAEVSGVGLDLVQLPSVALRVRGRARGLTNPSGGGPDVAAMAWLLAAVRASAG